MTFYGSSGWWPPATLITGLIPITQAPSSLSSSRSLWHHHVMIMVSPAASRRKPAHLQLYLLSEISTRLFTFSGQSRAEHSNSMVCLFVNNGDLITGAAKMISNLNSPLPSSLAVASCCRQTTDSRDNRGLHVFRIDIGATSDSSPCIPDWWQTLSAAAECGAVAGEVLTFWIKNEEWEEAGVLTMG